MKIIPMNMKKPMKALAAGLMVATALTGCGSGTSSTSSTNPTIAGVIGPTVTFLNNQFLFSMTIEDVTLDAGLTVPIPDMPNSSIEVGPDLTTNGILISVDLSLVDLVALSNGSVTLLNPQTLPGGRPLPGVTNGEIPAIAVSVPKWDNVVFYVGPTIFGLFVPVNIPLPGYIGTFRFFDTQGNDVGNISVVGTDTTGANSGILVLVPISGMVANLMSGATAN